MKKIVLYLMMLPMTVFAQKADSDSVPKLNKETLDTYQQMPAAGRHLVLTLLENTHFDDKGGFWVYYGDTIRNAETMALKYVEENRVTELCNIPFGSSYKTSKKILAEKYGDCDYLTSTKDCLAYRDKFYSGILFTDLFFMFQSDGEATYFNKAVLSKDTKTKEEAVQLKKYLDEKLSKKYQLYKILDEGNTCLSMGGICPTPSEGVFGGYAISVDVLNFDVPTREGCMHAVRIMYGPYDYVEENF